MKKVIACIAALVVVLIGLRLLVMQLEVNQSIPVPVVSTESPVDTAMQKLNHSFAEPGPKPFKIPTQDTADKERPLLMQAEEVEERIEATQAQSPEALFPEIAKVLEASAHHYNVDKHQQRLAKFVQSVAPSIDEINNSLQAMQGMQLSLDKQQAYTAMAQEKIASMQYLKAQAMAIDPNLMTISVMIDE